MHQISYFHMFSRKHIQVHRIAILDNDGYIYIVGIPLLLDTNCLYAGNDVILPTHCKLY